MADASSPKPRRRWFSYVIVILITAAATFGLAALLMNIFPRKQESEQHFYPLVKLDESSVDPETWKANFPRQYDTYQLTAQTPRSRPGASEAFSKLEEDPRLARLYAGYAFSVDYRERRGHANMLA